MCGKCSPWSPPSASGAEIDPMLTALRGCADRLSPALVGEAATTEPVAGRRQRLEELLRFLALVDGLAQRFFESNTSLRAAMELLARNDEAARE